MHDTAREKVVGFIDAYLAVARNQPLDILDVGSRVVDREHADLRDLLEDGPWRYRGLDVVPGPNVDVVVDDPYRWDEIDADSVDLVVSAQALEHVPYFWMTAFEIGRVMRPGGLALIIVPSRGFEHRHPVDCWRFYRDGVEAIAALLGFRLIDSFTDWDRSHWADSLLIMQKPIWSAEERAAYLTRREHQWCALTGAAVRALPPLVAVEPSLLAAADPGRLSPMLERIRQHDIAVFEGRIAPDGPRPAERYGRGDGDSGALTLREARQQYFDTWGFGDGAYEATWVTLAPIGGMAVGFPNTDARRRAVKFHDLHHVLTGYAADWTGEAEIGAWELGAGCGAHVPAWILNLLALVYGVVLAPRRTLAAMARGRRSRSLYAARELDERLLDERVADVRRQLGILPVVEPGVADLAALAAWWVAGLGLALAPVAAIAALARAFA